MEKKTGIGKRLLSMLLAATVMVTAQGMPVACGAGTVIVESGNEFLLK